MRITTRFLILALLTIALGASGCTVAHPTTRIVPVVTSVAPAKTCLCRQRRPTVLAPSPLNRYTPEEDIALGASSLKANRFAHFGPENLVIDTPLQTYLHGLLDELLAGAPDYARAFPYRIQLYRDPIGKNAYAVPGGWIFFSLEIISELPSEGALVGILAHEMGHIALRHSTAQMTFEDMIEKKTTLIGKMTALSDSIFAPAEYRLFLLFKEMEERGQTMTPEEHRRYHELEADIFAAQLMSFSRFNPGEFRDWHRERSCTCDGTKPHHRTHPLYAIRAGRIDQEMTLCAAPLISVPMPGTFVAMRNRAQLLAARRPVPMVFPLPPPLLLRLPPRTGLVTK